MGEIRRWYTALRSLLSRHTVPQRLRAYHTLGAVLLTIFGLQVVTGVLLLFYYQPTPERAYESVAFLINGVTWGWAVRSLHRWSGEAMVIVVFLHMCRVFFTGAFKRPREVTWVVGFCLLMTIFGLVFTGYLLPWDQKAYWGTTIGAQMAHQVPVFGDVIAGLMKGGKQVGAATLTRFFALHVVVLPAALAVLIMLHVGLVYRLGIADPLPRCKGGSAPPGRMPYAQFLRKEMLAGLLTMATLLVWTAWYPAGLGAAADPAVTPEHIKPDWPFLAFYQSLKYFPSGDLFSGFAYLQLAVLLQGLPFLLILLVPFLDRSVHRRPRRRKWATGIALGIILLWVVLTYLGHYAGGDEPIFGLKVL
ncbi:MAG: cytochrome b N-terminal domain-containing protein [Candidatus Neomarinimicrobiota bacterium]